MIKEICWFSQINFVEYFPHRIKILFLSSLFQGVRISVPNLEFSPSHVPRGFSPIAFPMIVLPKDDQNDFAQEE